ncbi:glycoside hydrolase family 18 protein [Suillus clintonianus]|uniref:glycoside hydrolase family 18 protein n=1 Tax=Suillus clintonianus TaxID=1904413 RepID=UPI001B882CEC|nr:glycoside hydrolase family 18 protein [Suillus clintonianus]KAG2119374.1 glycoside hydrolase family 18 protein [Suillus clintonianus]
MVVAGFLRLTLSSLLLGIMTHGTVAFDMLSNENLAVYWGQNSYGAINPDNTAHWQQTLSYYCKDNVIDTFPIAFLVDSYAEGNLPSIDLANICNSGNADYFPGTGLLNCSFLASDIEMCQSAGKAVTISLGGGSGNIHFQNDAQAAAYAKTIWNLFLGGTSKTRPFGSAILDGIDMDIEGGSQTGYVSFLTALRKLMNRSKKKYYITAAPQCPYPDGYIGKTLNTVGFDAVYVQFYNNYCGLKHYNNRNDWNFATWDKWAKNVSPNRDVKVYIGAPASSAAGSGYVNSKQMTTIIQQTRSNYSSFGGVMLWDVSDAHANHRYDKAVKQALKSHP